MCQWEGARLEIPRGGKWLDCWSSLSSGPCTPPSILYSGRKEDCYFNFLNFLPYLISILLHLFAACFYCFFSPHNSPNRSIDDICIGLFHGLDSLSRYDLHPVFQRHKKLINNLNREVGRPCWESAEGGWT